MTHAASSPSCVAPNNASTAFSVDGLGNVTQEVSPNSGATNAIYDGAGNVVTLTDARGIVRTQSHDALNRLTAVSYPTGGENVACTWDSGAGCTFGIGRLCAVSDNGGSTGFAYDARGNLLRQTRTEAVFTYTTLYSHDDADRLASVTAPSNQALTVVRDADGLVEEIITEAEGNPQLKLVEQVRTDAAGNVTAQRMGNNVAQQRSFAEDGHALVQAQQLPPGADDPPGGPSSDGDVPTLPKWGVIVLGILLLGIAQRGQRRGRRKTAGPGKPARLVAPHQARPALGAAAPRSLGMADADDVVRYATRCEGLCVMALVPNLKGGHARRRSGRAQTDHSGFRLASPLAGQRSKVAPGSHPRSARPLPVCQALAPGPSPRCRGGRSLNVHAGLMLGPVRHAMAEATTAMRTAGEL